MCVCLFAVSGFGYGAISGAFSLINVLADMTGPGTIGIYGHSDMFFITSGNSHCLLSLSLTSLLLIKARINIAKGRTC